MVSSREEGNPYDAIHADQVLMSSSDWAVCVRQGSGYVQCFSSDDTEIVQLLFFLGGELMSAETFHTVILHSICCGTDKLGTCRQRELHNNAAAKSDSMCEGCQRAVNSDSSHTTPISVTSRQVAVVVSRPCVLLLDQAG